VAVLTAASFSAQRCHAGSTALPGHDAGVRTPGLSTDLPGGNLGDLPSSLPSPSSPEMTRHDEGGSAAMLKVLNDPSLLAAAPGTPARAAMTVAPRPPVRETADPVTTFP